MILHSTTLFVIFYERIKIDAAHPEILLRLQSCPKDELFMACTSCIETT